ncbi:MAG: acyltransferase [Acidimicrobiia bacterium]|nr:acyltransferase [Acidimicrobiia bacterium]
MGDKTDLATRDPFIDALRVISVLVVVIGHWLTTTVIWEDGIIDIENALSVIRKSHVATWLIQVMPVMFFVGGFANARSLDLHGGAYLAYLRTRYRRLLTPTLVFIGVWLAIGVLAEVLLDELPNVADRAADLAALPFWFLGLYVFVVALAPPMRRLHRRFGWWVPGVLAVGVVVVDVLHHGLGVAHVGVLNYAFVWLLTHQFGFFHADGALQRLSRGVVFGVTTIGLAGLVVLTVLGSYPVSMVGVPGDERWNTNPPSLALVMLTLWLVGLVLLIKPWLGDRRWVSIGNRVVLTVFVWHVSAVSLGAVILYPLGFPRPDTGTLEWWAWRPVWIAALVPVMVILVVVFRRFEIHPKPTGFVAADALTIRHVAAGMAAVSLGLGILGFGVTGFNRVAQDLGEGVLDFDLNPLQNVLHLVLGLGLLTAVYQRGRDVVVAASGVALWFLVLGLLGISDGLAVFGMNPATAVLHVVLGALGIVLIGFAIARDRASRGGPRKQSK